MRKYLLFIAPFLFQDIAHAMTAVCTGQASGYIYRIRGEIEGKRVIGPVRASISGGIFGNEKSVSLQVVSSDIRPGSYLRASVQGFAVTGAVDANYDPSSGAYVGTVSGQAIGLGGSGKVNCHLGEGHLKDQFLSEDGEDAVADEEISFY